MKYAKIWPFEQELNTEVHFQDGSIYKVKYEGWIMVRPSDREINRQVRRANRVLEQLEEASS